MSVAAGVANIVSALPALGHYAVLISLGLIAFIAVMNLRGVKESGTAFAIPTYGFVASVFLVLVVGGIRFLTGHPPVAESAHFGIHATQTYTGLAAVLLALRAFAQGCTALTGVEAVSNGVPNFQNRRRARTPPRR